MSWQHNIIIPALLAALLTGCGGGASNGGTSTDGTSTGGTATGSKAATWTSIKWGGGGYVSGTARVPVSWRHRAAVRVCSPLALNPYRSMMLATSRSEGGTSLAQFSEARAGTT